MISAVGAEEAFLALLLLLVVVEFWRFASTLPKPFPLLSSIERIGLFVVENEDDERGDSLPERIDASSLATLDLLLSESASGSSEWPVPVRFKALLLGGAGMPSSVAAGVIIECWLRALMLTASSSILRTLLPAELGRRSNEEGGEGRLDLRL